MLFCYIQTRLGIYRSFQPQLACAFLGTCTVASTSAAEGPLFMTVMHSPQGSSHLWKLGGSRWLSPSEPLSVQCFSRNACCLMDIKMSTWGPYIWRFLYMALLPHNYPQVSPRRTPCPLGDAFSSRNGWPGSFSSTTDLQTHP